MQWELPSDVRQPACQQVKSSFETRTCLVDFTSRLYGDQISYADILVVDSNRNPIDSDLGISSINPTSSGLGVTFVLSGGSRGDYLLAVRAVTFEGGQLEGLIRIAIV